MESNIREIAEQNNNYFIRYRDVLKSRIVDTGGNQAFWDFLENSYFYVFSERKKYETSHFKAEFWMLRISFLITIANAFNMALVLNGIGSDWRWMIPLAGTVLSGFMTYIQAVVSKKKYHECWMRHNSKYISFVKECRDYAEYMGVYEKNTRSEEEMLRLFITRIYEMEDGDLDKFIANTQKLK